MAGMTDVVVRRRSGLLATVALAAGGLSATYTWWAVTADDGVAATVAMLLAVVSVGHALALWAAQKPLLVADDTGLRLRLGVTWSGLPWDSVQRIEVVERGRVRDGQVLITPTPEAGRAATRRWSARLAGWLNRRLHDEALAVPFGLTTRSSVVDLARSLDRLAAGRAVVVLRGDDEAPEPSVSLVERQDAMPQAHPVPRRAAVAATSAAVSSALASTVGRISRGVWSPRDPRPVERRHLDLPATATARREDVTIATRSQPASIGGLALSELPEPVRPPLPEADELRRPPYDGGAPTPSGNVSLIIDSTTALSARAMERARTRGRLDDDADEEPPADWGPLIGAELATARMRLGLDVDTLADQTRIRPHVIESIERDDFSPCGGDFYARGHLQTLSRVLELDADPLVATYDEHFASSPVNPREVFEVELANGHRGLLRGGERSSNWPALVAAVLALVIVWTVARALTDDSPTAPTVTEPTTSAAGLGSPGLGNPPVGGPRVAEVRLSAVGGDTRVRVLDRFRRTLFSGGLRDGDHRRVEGEAPLRVVAADGGVVRLRANGEPRGLMGDAGMPARERVAGKPQGGAAKGGDGAASGRPQSRQ